MKDNTLRFASLLFCAVSGSIVTAQGQVPAVATRAPRPVVSSSGQEQLPTIATHTPRPVVSSSGQEQLPTIATRPPSAVAPSAAQKVLQSVSQSGGWWQSLVYSQQLIVVESALSAFQTAYVDGVDATALLVRPHSFRDYMALTNRADRGIPQFSHTFGYYVSTITDFYTIHPEAMKAPVALVISCLADTPVRSCANVARESSAVR